MACAASTSEGFLDRAFELAPQVAVRPERFGALLYDFGTRRLSFRKSPRLLEVVQLLSDSPTAREACRSVGIEDPELSRYETALRTLTDSGMVRERAR